MLVQTCQEVEDFSLHRGYQVLYARLPQKEWLVHSQKTHISVHKKTETGRIYKKPVLRLIDESNPPVDRMTGNPLSHEIFYGIQLPDSGR